MNRIPVFVEKPPCVDLIDIQRLAKISNDYSVANQIGHNIRFSEAGLAVQKIANSDSFGRHTLVNLRFNTPGQKGDRWQLRSPLKAYLLSHLVHAIDYLSFVTELTDFTPKGISLDCKSDDISVCLVFDLAFGGIGVVTATNRALYSDFQASITGEFGDRIEQNGLLSVDCFDRKQARNWSTMWHPKVMQAGPDKSGYFGEFMHFFSMSKSPNMHQSHSNFRSEKYVYETLEAIMSKS